ncbi:MAG TPA: hypothetical protein VEY71_03655 [Chitinophagales bacterium]|nr:hypothetical protein [Chitinophagales bacterium]
MKNLLKNVMAVAVLVTIEFAAQAQEAGSQMKATTKAESVKGTKLKDRAATTENVRTKPLADQPGTGLKTETERPATNTAETPASKTKQSPKIGSERGNAKGIDHAPSKDKHAKSHVPRGKAHGWHRNHGGTLPRSK